MAKETVVLKVGGSVITKKKEGLPEVDQPALDRVCREIAEALKEKDFNLFIAHGVGPYGHVYAKKYRLDEPLKDGEQVKGIGITHRMVELLNYHVVDGLQKQGVNAINLQPSACMMVSDKKMVEFPTGLVKKYFGLGLVPVAYGDMVLDEKLGIAILSGDHIAPEAAVRLGAARVVFGADVDGVFTADPTSNPDARLIPVLTRKTASEIQIGGSTATDVTGGMSKKVEELLDLADHGIESEIVSALEPGHLKHALLGEEGIGTIVRRDK